MTQIVVSKNGKFVTTCSLAISLLFSSAAQAETLLIKNARIVSGNHPSASLPQDVLIEDGKILKIGKKLAIPKLKVNQQIDATGQFLIPGLIDTHVHLDGVPGYTAESPKDAQMLKDARAQMPRSYLYFGFTTVLDLTGDTNFVAKWNAQDAAPQAYFCAPVVIPNGYPAAFMDKDVQFQVPAARTMLFDPQQASSVYPANFKPEEHTPHAVVTAAKNDGASCIKVFYETGFGPKKNLPVPSVELIQQVVRHAHAQRLPVYLHGNSQAAYEFALKAGVDTLVHGMWHEAKNVDQFANQQHLEKVASEIVKANIAIQPTIQVLYGEHEELNPDFFQDPQVQHAIPKDLQTWYQSPAGQWMKNILAEDFEAPGSTPASQYQAIKQAYQKPMNTVKKMTSELHKKGAKIVFGSDTPSGPFYTQFPGINGRWEMDRWLEAGMSLPELFVAMTLQNAQHIGMEKHIGSVAVGLQADLLLLKDNPLKDVRAYDTITHVIRKGLAYQRDSLSALRLSSK